MERRILLLFTLLVVTGWFYTSMAWQPGGAMVQNHQQQVDTLNELEEVPESPADQARQEDEG